jgi:hypothetical protein
MIRTVAAASLIALMLAGTAAAQAPSGRPSPDANGDGFISKAEHLEATAHGFKRLDANGDGVLDQAELSRIVQMMGGNPFASADLDHDGKISRAEFDAMANLRFSEADADKDGKLSATEQQALRPHH